MTRPTQPDVKARPRGTGYITPIWAGDRWRFRGRFPDGAGGERTVGTYGTEDEAHLALNAQVEARARGVSPRAVTLTFLEWGERWLIERDDKNVKSWLSTWRTIVAAAPFASWPLDAVQRSDIRTWMHNELPKRLGARSGKPISRQTVKHAVGLVKRALAAAVEEGLLEQSPATGIKLRRIKGAKKEEGWTFLTPAEITAVFAAPDLPEKQRAAFAVAIYAGLREGELGALRWENVELRADRPRLHVVGSWDDTTKTSMDRRIALLPAARAALERWWRLSKKPTEGLVWSSERGGKQHGKQHRKGYDFGWADTDDKKRGLRLGWRRKAGIERRVRFHDLRHTFASHCVSGTWGRTWSLREVGEMLGHTTEDVTRRYAHLAETVLDKAAAATTPIRPESVRRSAAEPLQVPENVGRARQGSNLRPTAPEAYDDARNDSSFPLPDGLRTDALSAVDRLRHGHGIPRAEGAALASSVLAEAGDLVQLARAVLVASDAEYSAALLRLLERVFGAPARAVLDLSAGAERRHA